jgi:hypothetical protein
VERCLAGEAVVRNKKRQGTYLPRFALCIGFVRRFTRNKSAARQWICLTIRSVRNGLASEAALQRLVRQPPDEVEILAGSTELAEALPSWAMHTARVSWLTRGFNYGRKES